MPINGGVYHAPNVQQYPNKLDINASHYVEATANDKRVYRNIEQRRRGVAVGDKKRIKIVKVDLTCSACPSQWDMWDSKGRQYYARYRWGHLRIAQNINSYGDGKALISISWGEPGWGGCMPTSTMKQLTKKVFKYKD